MNKKEKVLAIREIFNELYPEAGCSLDYTNPLHLLIATQLAAQCTDARVNLVTPALFARYPTARDFANADILELQEYIRSTGFFRNKSKNIIACCQMLDEKFGRKSSCHHRGTNQSAWRWTQNSEYYHRRYLPQTGNCR